MCDFAYFLTSNITDSTLESDKHCYLKFGHLINEQSFIELNIMEMSIKNSAKLKKEKYWTT